MKVLVILGNDAYNKRLLYIVSKLLERNHSVELYARYVSLTYMFNDMVYKINNINDLDENIISKFDVILCVDEDFKPWIINLKKFIFSVNYFSATGVTIDEPSDFCFFQTPVRYMKATQRNSKMNIGSPEYDNAVQSDIKIKKFLFIDSGHYPFGKEGKQELAKTILKICYSFPDYELVIKPRFLENDSLMTHLNKRHLYRHIREECNNNIPDNLTMLDYHEDMYKLLNDCDVVICMCTTAYLDALACGKKLIVLSGLPNNNALDLNNENHWKTAYNHMSKSGCVVDYKNVVDYLPEGIECNSDHKKFMCVSNRNVSDKIVDVMEYIWDNFLSKGLFFKEGEYDYETFKEKMEVDETGSWNRLMSKRIRNKLCNRTRYIDCISYPIDMTKYISWADGFIDGSLTKYTPELDRLSYEWLFSLIIEYEEYLDKDPINQSYLIETLFEMGYWDRIEEKGRRNKILCMRTYFYFMGRICMERGDLKKGKEYLEKYMDETKKIEYKEYQTDRGYFMDFAKQFLAVFCVPEGANVAIYGAGNIGQAVYRQMEESGYCHVSYMFDKKFDKIKYIDNMKIYNPEKITEYDFEYIFICIGNKAVSNEVKCYLRQKGLPEEKIVSY